MICRRCMRAASRLRNDYAAEKTTFARTSTRLLSSTTFNPASISPNEATQSTPRQGDPSSSHNPPSATSTSAAQPFSTPLTSAPRASDLPVPSSKSSSAPLAIKSSVPAGSVLKGLNFMKGKQDPLALEDSEYPSWLWGILAEKENQEAASGVNEGDLFSKSKKQRRRTAKALRKQNLLNPEGMAPKVPLYEQSIDLPSGDGSVNGSIDAEEAREELTKAMRVKRRSSIKEDNFLRAMR